MKRVVYKYPLADGLNQISAPVLHHEKYIMHVGEQDNRLFIWLYLEDVNQASRTCAFLVVNTGESLDAFSIMKPVGTVQKQNGIVKHVFEVLTD